MRLSIRSPIMLSIGVLKRGQGAQRPDASGFFFTRDERVGGPAMSRILRHRVRALIHECDDPAAFPESRLVQAAGYVFDERREKYLAAVLGIMFLPKHPADVDYFGAGDRRPVWNSERLGSTVAGQRIFKASV